MNRKSFQWYPHCSRDFVRCKAILLCALVFSSWCLTDGGRFLSALPAGGISFAISNSTEDRGDVEQARVFEGYIQTNRYQEIEPLLLDYLKHHPNSWRVHYQLGYVYFRLRKISDSIKALSKSLELNINNAEAHNILGLNLTIIDRYDLAQTELEQAARLKPDSAEIHYHLARIYYTRGVYPQAQTEFEAALRLHPAYMKAYDNLGLTLEALGKNAAALDCYRKAVELNEQQRLNSEWPYINLSSFYNRQNQPEPALKYAQKAVELNPKAAQAHFQIAKAYQAREEWEAASKALTTAIETNPDSPDFYYVLSMVYKKLGKQEESRDAMATFMKLQQSSTGPSFQRARDVLPPVEEREPERSPD